MPPATPLLFPLVLVVHAPILALQAERSFKGTCRVCENDATRWPGECLDEFGLPYADPLRFPNMTDTAAEVRTTCLRPRAELPAASQSHVIGTEPLHPSLERRWLALSRRGGL